MRRRSPAIVRQELEETKERLELYLAREKEMISQSGTQMYTIGSRSLQRYQTALGDVQRMIETLRKRIRELEAELAGGSARRAVGVVPRDNW